MHLCRANKTIFVWNECRYVRKVFCFLCSTKVSSSIASMETISIELMVDFPGQTLIFRSHQCRKRVGRCSKILVPKHLTNLVSIRRQNFTLKLDKRQMQSYTKHTQVNWTFVNRQHDENNVRFKMQDHLLSFELKISNWTNYSMSNSRMNLSTISSFVWEQCSHLFHGIQQSINDHHNSHSLLDKWHRTSFFLFSVRKLSNWQSW